VHVSSLSYHGQAVGLRIRLYSVGLIKTCFVSTAWDTTGVVISKRARPRLIVLSHWRHVATHVATQVAAHVASVKGL